MKTSISEELENTTAGQRIKRSLNKGNYDKHISFIESKISQAIQEIRTATIRECIEALGGLESEEIDILEGGAAIQRQLERKVRNQFRKQAQSNLEALIPESKGRLDH